MKKRLLAIILSMIMFVLLLPMMAFADVTEYDLWVNGEQFTSDKLTIECGDGTAIFDPNRYKLTLTNATITEGKKINDVVMGIYSAMPSGLRVDVVGTNTIKLSDDDDNIQLCGIYYDDSNNIIVLEGSGILNIDLGVDCLNTTTLIYSDCALAISGITLNCEAADFGILASEYLDMRAKNLKLATRIESYLLESNSMVCELDDYEISVADNAEGTSAEIWNKATSLNDYKYVSMELTTYDVWVNGVRFTRSNPEIKCGDGTATYNPDKNELKLKNAVITDSHNENGAEGAICAVQDINIVTEGTNVINLDESRYGSGISVIGDLTLSGEGSLDITVIQNEGIFTSLGDVTVNMTGKLSVKTGSSGIEAAGNIDILGSGNIIVTAGLNGICAEEDVSFTGSGNITVNAEKYNGIYAGGDVNGTGSRRLNITSGKGIGILALENVNISITGNIDIDANDGIRAEEGSLELSSDAVVHINVAADCIRACNDVTLSGKGTFDIDNDISGESSGRGVFSVEGNIYITTDGIFDVNAVYDVYAPKGSVDIAPSGNVILNGINMGIYGKDNITISGSGDLSVVCSNGVGFGSQTGNLILSGTGKVTGITNEVWCVVLKGQDSLVLLNGKNPEVSFSTTSASDDYCAVYNSSSGETDIVAGDNFTKYNVTGAPAAKTVKYSLKTPVVSFDMGGHGDAVDNQIIAVDAKAEKPADPTADGFKFDGWYSDKECKNAFDFATAITEDTILYAKWTCLHANTEVKDAKAASLTEKGYTGDTYCKDCGELIKKGEEIPTLTPEPSGDPTPTTSPEPSGDPTPSGEPTPSPEPSGEPTPTTDPKPSGEPAPTGEPTPSAEPTPTQAPELNVGDFINRCYEVALGREADEAGYEYWVSSLNNGEACGAQVGYGFIFSSEYTNKNRTNEEFVKDMYAMYFGREADEAGFKYWVGQLEDGTATREDIMAGFANSEEFFNLCGKYGVVCGAYIEGVPNDQQGGVNCFVARLYKVCLNRLPDIGGQAGWVMKLMNGEATGSTCAYGFVFSPEFIGLNLSNADYVKYMYRAFFGREADEDGLAYWVGQLNDGTATRENVFAGFTGSPEFANLCASYGINA